MDLIASCKKKLLHFRIKELKDVLTRLGVSKQGKKQDLMDRILDLLSDEASNVRGLAKKKVIGKEGVADIIDDAYRKLPFAGATSASTNGENSSEINDTEPKEEVADLLYSEKKIRCPCGSSLSTEYMIQCADPQCLVFQHICCVIIQEEYSEGIPPIPTLFYCEICRIRRADPFWVTVAHLLSPVKLITTNNDADGANPLQNVERTFQLTRADMALLDNEEYEVQAWCILLNDKVPFRMQWPLFADLKVNGIPVRTVKRPGSQLLGANGRDDGPMITVYLRGKINQISLSGCDARSFCLGVRLVNQRTIQQILSVILEERNGEPFEDALARVRCCIGGGMATENGDSDSDLEVIADIFTVSLRCPMSGSRIKTAGRFRPCAHMGCFDLETFVQLNQRSKKWQCPICLKNYSLEDITVDPYFDCVAKMVQDCGEDITEIDVKPDGSWRIKSGYQFKNLEQWHLPDGSVCFSRSEAGSNLEASRHLNEERIAGRINPNNSSSPRDMQSTCRNQQGEHFGTDSHNMIIMSSSSSESYRDDGDCSVNEDCISTINTIPCNKDTTDKNMTDAWLGDIGIIVISDSEEENAVLTSPETLGVVEPVNNGGHSFSAPPTHLNAALDAGVSSSLGLFNNNGNGFEMPHQAFGSQVQPSHSANFSDTVIDLEYTPVTSSAPIDSYPLTSKFSMDSGTQVFGSSSNTKTNDSMVSKPIASRCANSPVQTSPPTERPDLTVNFDLDKNHQVSSDIRGGNLTSLGLGNGGGDTAAGFHAEPATSNGLDLVNQLGSNEALLPPRMNDEIRSNGTPKQKVSSGPFSFPRQRRSVRHRHFT
ncbi:E3 SUMO-protein ligase SIZ1-like isoform X3 [Rhododendron vialii]|uniref:E3 SUMO-protein ligase SIZ1-like isoform X3 n=1 Tax=Rhododendron vialii TaxID=182163 RepID=UPI00265E0B03|nr:E3 SUMO-protein ligase SIZ1-like isoform X3 [Rhododendron vialii]